MLLHCDHRTVPENLTEWQRVTLCLSVREIKIENQLFGSIVQGTHSETEVSEEMSSKGIPQEEVREELYTYISFLMK